MSNPETYERTPHPVPAAPPGGTAAAPAALLPNEEYYRTPPTQRPRTRSAGLGVALVIVGLVLLAFQLAGRSFSIGGGGSYTLANQQLSGNRIELLAAASDVDVQSWDGTQIKIEATQQGGARGDYDVDISSSGGTVRVVETSHTAFCFFCWRDVRYRISVPQGAQADIKTTSGDIVIDGLNGAVALATVSGDVRAEALHGGLSVSTTSGDVRLNDLAGTLNATTISGDVHLGDGQVEGATINSTSGAVEIAGVGGQLQIGTVSGDITVRDAHNGQLSLATTSGSIEYEGDLASSGNNEINTISGDVQLQLPDDSSFRLDASSVSGEVNTSFQLSEAENGRNSLKGVVGSGAATLTVGTTSGEITIESR